jgi:hypothetical protein
MITIVLYVVIIGCALVLRRQAQHHRIEESLEYVRLGWKIPPVKPRMGGVEVAINMIIGIAFIAAGGGILAIIISADLIGRFPEMHIPIALFLAIGISIVIVGIEGFMRLLAARRSCPPHGTLSTPCSLRRFWVS